MACTRIDWLRARRDRRRAGREDGEAMAHPRSEHGSVYREDVYDVRPAGIGRSLLPAERMPLNRTDCLSLAALARSPGVGLSPIGTNTLPRPLLVHSTRRQWAPPAHPGRRIRAAISYLDFSVPPSEQMNVEWVEVKVSITGPPGGPRLSKDQSHVAEWNSIAS